MQPQHLGDDAEGGGNIDIGPYISLLFVYIYIYIYLCKNEMKKKNRKKKNRQKRQKKKDCIKSYINQYLGNNNNKEMVKNDQVIIHKKKRIY